MAKKPFGSVTANKTNVWIIETLIIIGKIIISVSFY